jgi:tetratricopeptide (TPR) repeat protein
MRKVLELDPKRPDVYKSLGWFEMQKGQYEQAITNWRKALEINPQIPEMHNSIALALLGLGKQREAIDELKKDIQISPRSAFNYFMLGQVYLQLKNYDNARKSYEKAIALQPDYTNAYYGLFTVCTRLKEKTKAREYMAIFRELKAEDMKHLKDRNKVYDDLIHMRKGAAETFMQVGQMYQKKGDFHKAEEFLKRATTLDTENTTYLQKLAYLYQINNRISDALKLNKKIIELEPQNLYCHLNIGILSIHLKNASDAEAAFLKAIAISPKNSIGYRELAQLYLRAGTKLTKARELAEKAVELEASAVNYFVLSWACDKNGDPANGLKAIEQAIKLEPNNMRYKNVYEHIKKKLNR